MKYSAISAKELTSELIGCWSAIQRADFTLASPYFSPEFTQVVATVRDDVFIGLMESDGEVVGFFPFHRNQRGVARPVGLGLSDYHGAIAKPEADWNAEDLLRGCNLIRWEFDHLPVSQKRFADHCVKLSDSPVIELSDGLVGFEASRDKSGRKQLREIERKRKKLIDQIGPITFTLHSSNEGILQQMMTWKSLQCQRSGTIDYFSLDWCAQLVKNIHAIQGQNFGSILSCLHAGPILAAVHFVMYSHQVWHSWFPAYNHELKEYSPGFLLLLEMIRVASNHRVRHIDLGKGFALYKKRVMTSNIQVAEGYLALPSFRNQAWKIGMMGEQWARGSFLQPILRIPGRLIKNVQRKRRFI